MKTYLHLNSIGHLDKSGRRRKAIEYGSHITADEKRPMSSFVLPLVRDLSAIVTYDSKEQFDEDFATIREFLGRFKYEPPK